MALEREMVPNLSEAKLGHALAAWTEIVGAEHLTAYLDPFAVDPAGILAPGKQDIWPRAWRV